MKKIYQISHTRFLEKYGGLSLYDIDIKKIYKIDHKKIRFVKKNGYSLIGNLDDQDGTSTDHEYFFIHYDLFVWILATNQNNNIQLWIITEDVLFPSINGSIIYSSTKFRESSEIVSPRHILQRKIQKKVNNYLKKIYC